jgi:acyl-coenzyme A thioesterase PaaI-like protein
MRWLFNGWPPFRGAGIHVRSIDSGWTRAEVELRSRWLNRNYVGTHFGGSLFAMTDPFCMILMLRQLGGNYVVWDRAASIDFLKPGKGRLTTQIEITPLAVDEARQATASGQKYEPTFAIEVIDASGDCVARIQKTLYIRRKRESSAASSH